jgi:dienelactone hydrolase
MPRVSATVTTPDGSCPVTLHTPNGTGPWSGVVMWPDAGGYRDTFQEMADRLAGFGYAVLLPDVYYREGDWAPFDMTTVFNDQSQRQRLFKMIGSLTAERIVGDAPGARLEVVVTPQYPNMRRFIEAFPQATENAEKAIRAEGIEVKRTAIRGGTDGSRLSAMGLPTPNLFTGGHEYHSPREWASVQEMAAAAATVVRLAEVWALGAAPPPR